MSFLDTVPSFCFPSPSSVTSDQTSPRYSPQKFSLPSLNSVSKLDSHSPFRHDQESHPPASSPHSRSISHHSNWHPSPPSQHSPQFYPSTQHSHLPASIIPLSPIHTSSVSQMHSPHTHQPTKRRHAPSDSDITDHEHNDWRHNGKHNHKNTNIDSNSNVNLGEGPERSPTSSFAARTSYSHGWTDSCDKGHKNLFYRASDSSAVYTQPSLSLPQDNLPSLAPKPSCEPSSSSALKHASQSPKSPTQLSGSEFKDRDLAGLQILSARSAPKGPLPIETQIQLLRSVLKHDPFNCPIRRTTQAWECIAREQGVRARTCARRFDNIMQASISGRDRQTGTEEQDETKKALLEQLLVMMNQPQALVRMQKKRRYRSEEADRKLLLETIRLNPFGQKVGQVAKAWEDIRDALKMKVHARQCIRRVNRMIKPYHLRERMYKGNIPEEMQEGNDELIKQVIQLMKAGGSSALEEEGEEEDGYNSNGSSPDDTGSDSDFQDEAYQKVDEDEDQDMLSRTVRVQPAEGSDPRAYPLTSGVTDNVARPFASSRTTSSNSAWASSERSERKERTGGHGGTSIPGGMANGAIGGYSTLSFVPERRNDANARQDYTAPPPSFSGESSARFPFLPVAFEELQSPSTQLYTTILSEFRAVKRFMDQLDDQRQRDKHNQRSMMHMIEKLQYQMRQNQRQIEDLQSQLQFGPWKMQFDSGLSGRVFQTSSQSSSSLPYSGRDMPRPRSPSGQSHHHHREGKSREGLTYQGGSQGQHGHSRESHRMAHGSTEGGWKDERRDTETKRSRETLL
ncbi:hypothetical protein MVEG_07765 [Podila verticillata NRRL 6337]|nr:hypothetical protein MVEG_07765 [Podila verticillata NRRL 6337]